MKIHVNENLPKSTKEQEPKIIPYTDLFRFASTKDRLFMVLGSIAAFLNGGAIPSFSLIFGSMINSFQEAGDEMVR